jgi:hypothetical protein
MATYAILHTKIEGERPYWYQIETYSTSEKALHRARDYALNNGGYICVKADDKVIFGTDPVELDRAIALGINKHFTREPRTAAGSLD